MDENYTIITLTGWLGFLGIFEATTIWRLQTGTKLTQAFPLFSEDHGSEFKNLFILLAGLLTIVRMNCIWSPKSTAAWRACAMVHVLEAVYYGQIAFNSEETLPKSLSIWRKERHGEATLVYAVIVFNALLFTVRFLQVRYNEMEWVREQDEKFAERQVAAADRAKAKSKAT